MNIFNKQPCLPVFNIFKNNKYCLGKDNIFGKTEFIDQTQHTIDSWNSTIKDNYNQTWDSVYC